MFASMAEEEQSIPCRRRKQTIVNWTFYQTMLLFFQQFLQ